MHRRARLPRRFAAGPFAAEEQIAHTRRLDGVGRHLYVENGRPYMIFVTVGVLIDGAMALVELTPDLGDTRGEPVRLFRVSRRAQAVRRRARSLTDSYKSPKAARSS